MDRHQALQCFCRVVEAGGFAAAARDLDVSPSMVTKTIRQLEEWTGSRLLARTTRRMQLTEAGERFYAYARRVLDDTERTLGEIRSATGELSGRLVLAVPVSLTLAFLKDALHAFQAAHPTVELELRLSDRPVDLVRDGVDVALRGQAELDDSSLVAVPLMTMERAVAAAPDYWRRHGKPDHPQALAGHNCLPYLLGSDATRWTFDGPDGQRHAVEVRGSFRADNSLLLIDAMQRGIGVGLVPRVMMRSALAEGRLETALDGWRTEPRRVFAIYPSREHLPERVRALVRFLKERLAGA
jgi:DNA-binding transcriptional LysR family regulator